MHVVGWDYAENGNIMHCNGLTDSRYKVTTNAVVRV